MSDPLPSENQVRVVRATWAFTIPIKRGDNNR
jgi:hypothetical protein